MLFSAKGLGLHMADEIYTKRVLELQSEFMRRLTRHEPPPLHSIPSLLCRVIECDEDLLEFTLGKIGHKLRMFAQDVDFQHPEIVSIFDGVIANDQDFAQECMELLVLGQFAREHNLKKIIPSLGKILTKESLTRNIIKKIDVPSNNRMHVRLLKDVKDREEIRMTKRMQVIDLQSVYKKGEDVWNAQPDNFTKFLRFDTAYQDDLKNAEKKAQRYEELGCTSLAAEVRKSIESFREHMEQAYYGFNRMTMTSAAIILAKSLGHTYTAPIDTTYGNYGLKSEGKITVSRKFFGKYNFDPDQVIEFSHIVSQMAGSPIFTQKISDPFVYEPRVYPLHEFASIITDNVKNTISLLEAFPDAGGKPIFDHFGVIVPGVAFPNDKQTAILDEKGIVQSFSSREEAVKQLDGILIKGEYIYPVLFGEKDGRCFFISYWN
jgi:hypothetical protein